MKTRRALVEQVTDLLRASGARQDRSVDLPPLRLTPSVISSRPDQIVAGLDGPTPSSSRSSRSS